METILTPHMFVEMMNIEFSLDSKPYKMSVSETEYIINIEYSNNKPDFEYIWDLIEVKTSLHVDRFGELQNYKPNQSLDYQMLRRANI